jgi:hypothetical protein
MFMGPAKGSSWRLLLRRCTLDVCLEIFTLQCGVQTCTESLRDYLLQEHVLQRELTLAKIKYSLNVHGASQCQFRYICSGDAHMSGDFCFGAVLRMF